MPQKFYADKKNPQTWNNGAIGYGPSSPYDCLGPFAVVYHCPIPINERLTIKRTCYATGYADTFFSIPACTRYKGKYIGGYLTMADDGPEFRVYDRFKDRLPSS